MKRFLSINYSAGAFNFALLVLRVSLGLLMFIDHGMVKLERLSELKRTFFDPFHIGHFPSLLLCLFAEICGSAFLIIGLFSRVAAFLLLVDLLVAIFFYHRDQPMVSFELAIVFAVSIFTVLLVGPGKFSMDNAIG